MRHVRLLAALALAAMVLFAVIPEAHADSHGSDSSGTDLGSGSNENGGNDSNPDDPQTPPPTSDPPRTVGSEVEIVTTATTPPDESSEATSDGGESPPGTTFVSDQDPQGPHPDVTPYTPPCAEYVYAEVILLFDFPYVGVVYYDPPKCVRPLTCGAERIDDHYFGRLSGQQEKVGMYGSYLQQIVDGTIAANPVVDVDIDATNASILGRLGTPPDPLAMAEFAWCQNPDGTFFTEVGLEPDFVPRFWWGTNVNLEYPITAIRIDLLERVRAEIGLYNPVVATVPPLDTGHTFVKFPTWLWVDEPLEVVPADAESDVGTVQVQVRGTLTSIDFQLGDVTVTCTPDELKPYVKDETHPIEDVGPCHHVFDEVGDFDIVTRLTYEIEERTRHRFHRSHPWPDIPWTTHPTEPVIPLETNAGTYGVHELLALNVNDELALGTD